MKVRITHDNKDQWCKIGEVYEVEDVEQLGRWGGFRKVIGVDKYVPSSVCKIILEKTESATIDSHYNFTYTLTEFDIELGCIKLDPYFVSQQWNLGTKDPSGVIWHIFKTCARFGEKNDKAREIKAIYKSIKRLAELEGVTLES